MFAPSAFLASAAATLELQDGQAFNAISPQDVSATRQRNWDKATVLEGRRV